MGETPTTPPPSSREPSAAVRGDPMLRAVATVEAAMQLSAAGTGGASAPLAPTTKPPPPPPPSPKVDIAAQRAAEIERREASLQAEQAKLDAEAARQQEQLEAIRAAQERQRDPLAAAVRDMKEAGLTLEDIAHTVLNDGQPPPELIARRAREEVAELRAELSARDQRNDQAALEAQRAERAEAQAALRSEIDSIVQTEPEKYEAIAFYGEQNAVYRELETAFRKGEELTPAEAADRVERRLGEKMEGLLKTKKVAARLKQQGSAAGPARPGSEMDRAVQELIARGLARY